MSFPDAFSTRESFLGAVRSEDSFSSEVRPSEFFLSAVRTKESCSGAVRFEESCPGTVRAGGCFSDAFRTLKSYIGGNYKTFLYQTSALRISLCFGIKRI